MLSDYYLIFLLSFYLIVIINDSEFINDNSNSFIDIDKFDSNDDGTDIKEPNDNNKDLIILLFNIKGTPLNTINKEDERLIFSLILKKTKRGIGILFIKQRIQSLYQFNYKDPLFKVIKDFKVLYSSLYKIREKAIINKWVFNTLIKPRHIDDRLRSSRLYVSIYIITAILTILI